MLITANKFFLLLFSSNDHFIRAYTCTAESDSERSLKIGQYLAKL